MHSFILLSTDMKLILKIKKYNDDDEDENFDLNLFEFIRKLKFYV